MLFVMGEQDTTALGQPPSLSMLTGAIEAMPAKQTVELHRVAQAGHNPLDTPVSGRAESHTHILAAVQSFISHCTS
eukprot:COSAG01_NODE_827_length_13280_cov_8.064107_6_plen_76_part_00